VSSGIDEGGKIKYQKAKSKITMQNAKNSVLESNRHYWLKNWGENLKKYEKPVVLIVDRVQTICTIPSKQSKS
jgi:hypothetical protein